MKNNTIIIFNVDEVIKNCVLGFMAYKLFDLTSRFVFGHSISDHIFNFDNKKTEKDVDQS